jgi:hypothetical protein
MMVPIVFLVLPTTVIFTFYMLGDSRGQNFFRLTSLGPSSKADQSERAGGRDGHVGQVARSLAWSVREVGYDPLGTFMGTGTCWQPSVCAGFRVA